MANFDIRKFLIENRLTEASKVRVGDKYIDDDGDVFTVISVSGNKIKLKDGDGIPTTYPDDFDEGSFESWFTKKK